MARKFSMIRSLILDGAVFGSLLAGIVFLIVSPSFEDLLNLTSLTLVSVGCFLAGMAIGVGVNRAGIKTLGEAVFEHPSKKANVEPKPFLKTFWGLQLTVAFFAMLIAGLQVTNFSFYELFSENGFDGAKRIFSALASPNFSVLPEAVLAIIETIFIAFIATTIAVPAAFLLAFFAAKNIVGNSPFGFVVYTFLRTILNVARSIEPLIWAIIFSVWVGIGPFAGMLALMLHSVASLTKQYSEIIECVEHGPIEGIQSTGAGPMQVVWFAVVPQIILPYVSFTIYRWDINVRMATIIGLVGGGGIGTMLIQYQGQALWHEVGCIVLVIAVVVWVMDTASAYIREAIK